MQPARPSQLPSFPIRCCCCGLPLGAWQRRRLAQPPHPHPTHSCTLLAQPAAQHCMCLPGSSPLRCRLPEEEVEEKLGAYRTELLAKYEKEVAAGAAAKDRWGLRQAAGAGHRGQRGGRRVAHLAQAGPTTWELRVGNEVGRNGAPSGRRSASAARRPAGGCCLALHAIAQQPGWSRAAPPTQQAGPGDARGGAAQAGADGQAEERLWFWRG